ncbi:Uncharacterised protein [Mycobacterium tuberculosis]|nr:Uncharacterised protein [Mycobacterium tuberculosis]CKV20813.1 Uncharacterised protein [Mycobacterium tuberculosis]
MFNVASINGNHNLNLLFQFLQELDFVVRFITRKDTSSVEIF